MARRYRANPTAPRTPQVFTYSRPQVSTARVSRYASSSPASTTRGTTNATASVLGNLRSKRTGRPVAQTLRTITQAIARSGIGGGALGALAELLLGLGSAGSALTTLIDASRGGGSARGSRRTSQTAIDRAEHTALERAGFKIDAPNVPAPRWRSVGASHQPAGDLPAIPLDDTPQATVIGPRSGGGGSPGGGHRGGSGSIGRGPRAGGAGGGGFTTSGGGGGRRGPGHPFLGGDGNGPSDDNDRYIRVHGSSNVYAFGYDRNTMTMTVQYLSPLLSGHVSVGTNAKGKRRVKGTPGKTVTGKSNSPGPVYEYFGVPLGVFNRIKNADSKGTAIWDQLRVRNTMWGHRYDYRLAGVTNAPTMNPRLPSVAYVPRKAVADDAFQPRFIMQHGQRFRSLLPSQGMPDRTSGLR